MTKDHVHRVREHMHPGVAYHCSDIAVAIGASEPRVRLALEHLIVKEIIEKIPVTWRGRRSYLYHLRGQGPVTESVSEAPRAYRNLRLDEDLKGYDTELVSHMKLAMETRK